MVRKKLIRREVTHNIPTMTPFMSRLFAGRGIRNPAELDHKLHRLIPPDSLSGAAEAADIVADAIIEGANILIIGDFDADGATSCALMVSGLKSLGATRVNYLVPDRFKYGYGLTPAIVDVAAQLDPDLLITVDNGMSSVDGVHHAGELGFGVIITDHHLPGPVTPDAAAIVNPNQPDDEFPSKHLAGVGVAFYLLSCVRISLRAGGWFETHAEPRLADWLDLVALGTIADVVRLDYNNRILVAEGLRRIRGGHCRPGIKALLEVAGCELRFTTSQDLAFSVAPRLNAAGRLQDISVGIECLLADEERAKELAEHLNQLNTERKEIEIEMRQQAEQHIRTLSTQDATGVCLFHEEWHQGVVGIVASRIKELYNRPVVAFARGEQDELKGSGRSIQGFHIRDALDAIAARNPGLIIKFGGHAMAAGLSLDPVNLETFAREFDREAKTSLSAVELENTVMSDGSIDEPITAGLAVQVVEGAPWGQGFPEPVFDGVFEILEQKIVGSRHLKLMLQPRFGNAIDAIWFNNDGLIDAREIHCAYRLDVNRYRGKTTPQLIIETVFL